jgi:hypothetical protein
LLNFVLNQTVPFLVERYRFIKFTNRSEGTVHKKDVMHDHFCTCTCSTTMATRFSYLREVGPFSRVSLWVHDDAHIVWDHSCTFGHLDSFRSLDVIGVASGVL